MGVISYPDYTPVSLMLSSLFLPSWLAGLSVWVSCSRAGPHTSCPSRPCSRCHSLKRPGRWSYRISKLVGWSGCLHVGSFPWFLSSCNVDLVPLPPQLCWLCSLCFTCGCLILHIDGTEEAEWEAVIIEVSLLSWDLAPASMMSSCHLVPCQRDCGHPFP